MSTSTVQPTLVSTYDHAKAAAEALSRHLTLVLDCEGKDLGRTGGVLGIISIGDASASEVYVFDVLALDDKSNPLLLPLFSLLRNKSIMKLVWDGRATFVEIADTYGVLVQGILDVQMVEVMQRPAHNDSGSIRAKQTINYFKKSQVIMEHIARDPTILDGIYRLMNLEHCAGSVGVHKDVGGKNPAVTALHKANGSEMWLQRPLPLVLLDDAARNVQLVTLVYARIVHRGAKHLHVAVEKNLAASASYMRVYPTRELRELHIALELSKFMPLDILDMPDPTAPQYRCAQCERMLSLSCFFTRAVEFTAEGVAVELQNGQGSAVQRMPLCRLCVLVARRNTPERETSLGEWVLLI